jgi:hypothetical protein
MPTSRVNDSKHWRDRAAEMRALSDMMKDNVNCAEIMQRLADDYTSSPTARMSEAMVACRWANEKPRPAECVRTGAKSDENFCKGYSAKNA